METLDCSNAEGKEWRSSEARRPPSPNVYEWSVDGIFMRNLLISIIVIFIYRENKYTYINGCGAT